MIDITPQYLASQGLSESFPARFWSKVNKNGPVPPHRPELGPCWVWTGPPTVDGYGRIWSGIKKVHFMAHVGSWMLHVGPVEKYRPGGMHVLHKCDNPPCVRPEHLWLGNDADNCRDMVSKGRSFGPRGELHGACKLTEQQAILIKKLYASGVPVAHLSRQFPIVTGDAIWRLVHGRNWKYLNKLDLSTVPDP